MGPKQADLRCKPGVFGHEIEAHLFRGDKQANV